MLKAGCNNALEMKRGWGISPTLWKRKKDKENSLPLKLL
jgi:hypothetical protein